jgi:hypothetical protein
LELKHCTNQFGDKKARLPDKDIRDITQLLERGDPLPDKYRFTLFGDDREIELVWNGESSEVTNVVLPFQTIEDVDEPRPEKAVQAQPDLFDLATGRQLKGWTNKLIWGDNKFILSSLKNGPLREEIEANGGIKLIYIDPPFDVGADFTMDIEVGDETLARESNVLEELAPAGCAPSPARSEVADIRPHLPMAAQCNATGCRAGVR